LLHRAAHIPEKAVCVPGSEPVDISEYIPLIDHPLFQRLRRRKQLGVNHLVFPGAVHTRFEHALGVLALTERLCRIYGITGRERKLLGAFALIHDIGHGPFSHQIEPIAGGSHNRKGMEYMERMESQIQACGLDTDEVRAMFGQDNDLARFVSDRNLGTDKLDYLRRDALHIGFCGAPDIEKVLKYSHLQNGQWAVEEKFIEDLKRIQKFYSYLHQHGYLNKTALSVQRVFQRAVQEEIQTGTTTHDALWEMVDDELESRLYDSRSQVAKTLYATLENRRFHRSAYVIKPAGYGFVERISGKDVSVSEWSMDKIGAFSSEYSDCEALMRLEDDLAAALGLNAAEVLFAAMPYFDKLVPRDVKIFSSSGQHEYMLFDNDKDHLHSLKGDYLRTFAIRIIVPPRKRRYAAQKGELIESFLRERI